MRTHPIRFRSQIWLAGLALVLGLAAWALDASSAVLAGLAVVSFALGFSTALVALRGEGAGGLPARYLLTAAVGAIAVYVVAGALPRLVLWSGVGGLPERARHLATAGLLSLVFGALILAGRRLARVLATSAETGASPLFRQLTDQELVRRNDSAKLVNTLVQTIAILLAGGWGIYTFIYKEKIAPAALPHHVVMHTSLERLAASAAGLTAIQVRIDLHNQSQVRNYVPLSRYWLLGEKVEKAEFEEAEFRERIRHRLKSRTNSVASRHFRSPSSKARIVSVGKLYHSRNWFLDPNEKFHRSLVLYVPSGEYDRLRLKTDLWLTRRPDSLDIRWGDNSSPPEGGFHSDEVVEPHYFVMRWSPFAGQRWIAVDRDASKSDLFAENYVHTEQLVEFSLWRDDAGQLAEAAVE